MVRPFSRVTELVANGEHRFRAEVDPEWTIGGKPNGGYLLSLLGRAAALSGPHPHVIAASAHYLHSPDPGAVDVEVEPLRVGRSASQTRVRLLQETKPCVEAVITTAQLDPDAAPYWDGGLPARSETAYDDCPRLIASLPSGNRVAIMEQVEVRLEDASLGFTRGQPRGRGELWGWLTLPDDEAFDPEALVFAVDAFPPATFDIEFAGWVPTLELTVYVRALPAPGPVQILHRAHLIEGQRVDESCVVWDSTGRLVAQGTQLAGIRLG
jgi:acyl-coenzyme A thioesterase PaaI-like protein